MYLWPAYATTACDHASDDGADETPVCEVVVHRRLQYVDGAARLTQLPFGRIINDVVAQ